MKSLDALMQELCPEGVEFVKLGEVCKIERGVRVVKKELHEIGKVPVFQNSLTPLGYRDVSNCLGNTSFVISAGAAGEVGFSGVPFWAADDCLVVNCPPVLDNRYSYYFLKNQEDRLKSKVRRASVPRLSRKVVEDLEIPLPPISIQAEIVRILDTFTSLEAELEKELDTELDCRKRQYAYYRDTLLSFEGKEGVAWKKLGEVCEILDSKRKPVAKGNRVKGDYPYYGANGIQDYIDGYLFDGVYLLLGEDGSVINKDNSPILNWATGKIWVNNHAHVLAEKKGEAILRYLYYVLQTCDVSPIVRGVPPKLNQENLRNIEFPIPSLEEQRRIVAILDRFESLTTSLQSGLPAEIAARRQQYAHYRDKLLTFRRKGAN